MQDAGVGQDYRTAKGAYPVSQSSSYPLVDSVLGAVSEHGILMFDSDSNRGMRNAKRMDTGGVEIRIVNNMKDFVGREGIDSVITERPYGLYVLNILTDGLQSVLETIALVASECNFDPNILLLGTRNPESYELGTMRELGVEPRVFCAGSPNGYIERETSIKDMLENSV